RGAAAGHALGHARARGAGSGAAAGAAGHDAAGDRVAVRLRAALLVALLAASAGAQKPPPEPPPVPPTQLGIETPANSPTVVVARVISVRPAGVGGDLVRVRVLERMRGDESLRDAEVTVLSPAGALSFGDEDLLFLRPFRGGDRLELVQVLSAHEPH